MQDDLLKPLCLDDVVIKESACDDIRVLVELCLIKLSDGKRILDRIDREGLPDTGDTARKLIVEEGIEIC